MWNKSAMVLMVRVKVKGHWGFIIPMPLWVVDQFFEAVKDLVSVGEMGLKLVPLPQEENARKHLRFVKAISLSGLIAVSHSVIKELRGHKGLDVVDVETGDVQVKVQLR